MSKRVLCSKYNTTHKVVPSSVYIPRFINSSGLFKNKMTAQKVDIGFLEEKDNWLLHPKFFPSKVGGKPAWLDLKNLPHPNELTCRKCSDPLILLCQVSLFIWIK